MISPPRQPRHRDGSVGQGQKMATRLEAGSTSMMCTAPVSAYEQLPRGAMRPLLAVGARGPDGRDRPHARNRATEQGSTR
jgi:hypothetical protein